jgi:hypothetical protein
MLAIELQDLADLDFEVELTGFSVAEIDIVLDAAREALLTAPTPRARTRSRPIDMRSPPSRSWATFGCSGVI